MMLRFNAEDLVSIIIEETITSEAPISVAYRRINSLRNELRKKGITSDLGQREIETISSVFPENIQVESTCVRVVKTAAFVSRFEYHATRIGAEDMKKLKEMWEGAE